MPESEWSDKVRSSLSGSKVIVKLVGVFFLVLMLLVPLGMIENTLAERLERRNAALEEITSMWGKNQTVVGPVLVVPFRRVVTRWEMQGEGEKAPRVEVKDTALARAFFLPSRWSATGDLEPHARYRGIYRTTVYSARVNIEGTFDEPDYDAIRIAKDRFLWDRAFVSVGVPDLRGAREALALTWGDSTFTFASKSEIDALGNGVHADLKAFRGISKSISFRIPMTFNGKSALFFAPVGLDNHVELRSVWADPSFRGAFLPVERSVTPQGFSARWAVSHLGRDYPQFWTDLEGPGLRPDAVNESLLGVELATLVDSYRNVERAVKYGVLFLALVFTAFILFEAMGASRVHAFQYLLVGAALCLFFLLLLSLSEVMRFGAAYLAASTAAILLISLYSSSVLRKGRAARWVAAMLVTIHGFLYVTLQLQDYALLTGSIGLTIALAAVMYVTRGIDWYDERQTS